MDFQALHILTEADRQRVLTLLRNRPLLNHRGEHLVVYIARDNPKATIPQKALMGAWHGLVAEHTGHEKAEVHEFIKRLFLPSAHISEDGEWIRAAPSVADLTKEEMKTFLDRYQAWAKTSLDLDLPHGRDVAAWEVIRAKRRERKAA